MKARLLLPLAPLLALVPTLPGADQASPPERPAFIAAIRPALPSIPEARFDVRSQGAKGDGTTPDTGAIQAAIDAAKAEGGGTVELPAGIYLSGPLHLASKLRLHLAEGAVLRMLPLAAYPGGTQDPADLLGGADLHDVVIDGPGTIDGQGSPWWPFAKTKGARRPRMIALSGCDRVLIAQVTLRDSPMFHIAIGGSSSNVTVRGVTIRAPASDDPVNPSHNTDACDVSGHQVLIENCDVSVGDDNFTCGGGTSDVLIRNNTYGRGHGVSIGSYTHRGGVARIAVLNCTFEGTECGIRIKSDRDRGGDVHDLYYEGLTMEGVRFPILIYGSYLTPAKQFRDLTKIAGGLAVTYPAQPVGPLTPVFHDITFRNITATTEPGRRAGLIWGLPEAPAYNITLDNVHLTADRPFGVYFARNVRVINSTIATPEGMNRLDTAEAEVSFQ